MSTSSIQFDKEDLDAIGVMVNKMSNKICPMCRWSFHLIEVDVATFGDTACPKCGYEKSAMLYMKFTGEDPEFFLQTQNEWMMKIIKTHGLQYFCENRVAIDEEIQEANKVRDMLRYL